VSFWAMKEPTHLALHPFGQIPTYEEGDLSLFETGAIAFRIAQHHAGLLPRDAKASHPGSYPNLAAHVARGEARPACKRAFDAQLAVNRPPD
jgi:glutathione S-transferase